MEQQIADIASWVFWSNVQTKSYWKVQNYILNHEFYKLWEKQNVYDYLTKVNLTIDSLNMEQTVSLIYKKVNDLLKDSVLMEYNINGTIYLEDTVKCKSPHFKDFDLLQQLKLKYLNYLNIELPQINKLGTLLLRTPLPSIVFTNEINIPNTFIVKNTQKAIGFHVNLFYDVDDAIEFPTNIYNIKFCLFGKFRIQNHNSSDNLWKKLIPNCLCFDNLTIL